MSFEQAVYNTETLGSCMERGLQALGPNSVKIKAEIPRQIDGSVDLDSCVSGNYPNDSRWDYIIGYNGEAYFIEVHPAQSAHVNEVIKKLDWLKSWLNAHAPELNRIKAADRPFRWVATSNVHIIKGSPQALRLAQSGLAFPEKITRIK
ncbi:MAG: hypothetical protein LAT75_05870 [Candidatus Cyclonatronum sp.]|uniref:hypothetical protein n=1 Tax=Cyclonatronum sp. TaxID=3024185 RepID=UPI0025BA7EAB|nr:hypothetical protein [Cyclonatronum sp.]MCH8486373.1 hypothetical protein [Cyclonatronum sp.]